MEILFGNKIPIKGICAKGISDGINERGLAGVVLPNKNVQAAIEAQMEVFE